MRDGGNLRKEVWFGSTPPQEHGERPLRSGSSHSLFPAHFYEASDFVPLYVPSPCSLSSHRPRNNRAK